MSSRCLLRSGSPCQSRSGRTPQRRFPTVLAIYNKFPLSSSRYKNLVAFTDAFLATIPRLGQPPRHPKWKEIDVTTKIDGWPQFVYFRDAVDRLQ